MFQNLDQLKLQFKRENLHEVHAKTCLEVLRLQFKEYFASPAVNSSDHLSQCWQDAFNMYMYCDPETYRRNLIEYLDMLVDVLHESVLQYGILRMKENEVNALKENGRQLHDEILHEHQIMKSVKMQSQDIQINPVQAVDDSSIVSKNSLIESENNNALSKSEIETQMHMREEKVDMREALDVGLVVTESSGTNPDKQDTSSSSENYTTHAVDANIRPVNDEEPFAEVQLTAQHNILANEQQHTEQSEPSYDTYLYVQSKRSYDTHLLETIDSNPTPDSTNMCTYGERDLSRIVARLLAANEQLHKENEHLKQTYKELYDLIKKTRVQNKDNNDSLISQINQKFVENADLEAQIQEKVIANAALKNELRKLKGNSVETKFAKASILGKPPLQPSRNHLVVRQPNAFTSERPRISRPRFASNVDEKNDLSKIVTPHYLPKARESAPAKPHHKGRKKTQDKTRIPNHRDMASTRAHCTPNACTPKLRNIYRSSPVSKCSGGMSNGLVLHQMTFEQNSLGLVLHQMTFEQIGSSLALQRLMSFDHISSSLVPQCQMASAGISSGPAPQRKEKYTMAEENIPAPEPTRRDEQILHASKWLQIGKGNLLLEPTKLQKNPILRISLFWNTLTHDAKTGVYSSQVDEHWLTLNAGPFSEGAKMVTPPTQLTHSSHQIGKGNLLLDLQKLQKNPIFRISVDIRQNINFVRTFTTSANVPSIYIQLFWNTLTHDVKTKVYSFQVDEHWLTLSVDLLWKALDVTLADSAHPFESPPAGKTDITFTRRRVPSNWLMKMNFNRLLNLMWMMMSTIYNERRIIATQDETTRPSAQPEDASSAQMVRETLSHADAETGVDEEKTNSEADTEIMNIGDEQGEDATNTVALEEITIELDKGQARSNTKQSYVALAGPNPEPMHGDFLTTIYPKVHKSLKHTTEEHVHLENPPSSSETLSSMKNLEDNFTFGDQFINDKSQEDEPGKTTMDSDFFEQLGSGLRLHQMASKQFSSGLESQFMAPDQSSSGPALYEMTTITNIAGL
ncbi:hypothetical protein Tco_1139941, partial [Tanacetum coccineum]